MLKFGLVVKILVLIGYREKLVCSYSVRLVFLLTYSTQLSCVTLQAETDTLHSISHAVMALRIAMLL